MLERTYIEHQSFRFTWSYWLCLALTLLFFYACFQQIILQQPFGNNPAPNSILVLCCLLMLSLCALLHFSSLQFQLDKQGLAVRFVPFINDWRKHAWQEIKDIRVVSYNPIGDYGGWGIRGAKNRRCYNISGKQGLEVLLQDGKHILIGTQQKDQLSLWLAATKTTRA